MIVEIGTSDFRTDAGKQHGLFVEPVREYFDRLPDDCLKENVAVSDYEGDIDMWYIPSHVIESKGLPNWLRGCNSVNGPHATVVKMGLQEHLVCDEVQVVRIKSLLDKHGILEIDHLKIDTEGHDCVILNDFLDTCSMLPNRITFENNVLSDPKEVNAVVQRLKAKGYKCEQVNFDTVCRL
jgi:FkbM family methyltransferase